VVASIGHNSGDVIQKEAQAQLRAFLEQVENLDDEKAALSEAISEKYKEIKSAGFDTKALRKIVAIRKKDKAKHLEEKAMVELYAHALGVEDLV
jgi:uncharacterized protein (UPF0335 family)